MSNIQASEPIIAGVVFLGFGALVIYKALKDFKTARKIKDTATSNIRSAPMGLVEIQGYAWPAGEMVRDRFQNLAIFLSYKVEKFVKRGKKSKWVTVYQYKHETPFYVLDGTGVCLVKPNSDRMELTNQTAKLSGSPTNHEELVNGITKNPGFIMGLFIPSYRIVEKKILIGSQVYACGSMQSAGQNKYLISGDYKKFLTQVKAFKVSPILQLQKLDINKDGKITDNEKNEALSRIASSYKIPIEETTSINGVISDNPEHELIVSDCGQEELIKRLSGYNNLKILVGVALVGLGAYLIKFMK